MNARLGLAILLVPYTVWLVFAYDYHFLDGVNLLFHEAGHPLFGLFGQTLGFLGGTLMQLIMPAAAGVHFLGRSQRFEAMICGFWIGESLLNIAWYMADAMAMAISRVGGEIHDWNWLFQYWGVLEHCEAIAGFTHVLGSGILVATLTAAFALARMDSKEDGTEGP